MRNKWYSASRGFILPTVVIASVVLMLVLTVVSQSAISTGASMSATQYNGVAADTAESGVLRANDCIKQNGVATIVWKDGTALYPGTDCNGATSCTDPSCYIVNQPDMRTYFKVVSETTSTGIVTLTSYGYTDLLRQDGSVWKTYTTSAKLWNATVGIITPSLVMQNITPSACPSTMARAVDARDNRTYWVQKLADGKCWMLTNLAYAGGGTNTYGDIKSISNSETMDYTRAYYMIPPGSNVTTEPTNPSTSTTGTSQYGYFYNWCAAMGAQTSTSVCSGSQSVDNWNHSISICPSGWRLPTGASGGEFTALNNAVNAGRTNSDSGLIAAPWLGQRGGYWSSIYVNQGTIGEYWSSTLSSTQAAYMLAFASNSVVPAGGINKNVGNAVRCVADSVADGRPMQTITNSNCPTTRTRTVDARDNHTYWVQKLADGKCWMLTNLAYSGGGTNTYGDVKSIGANLAATYTAASYYIPTGSNVTTEPTNPSISTSGTGQYGYLYNWCAAMGAQLGTGACANSSTPAPNTAITICPSGWRLPVGNGNEIGALNTAINGGSTTTDTGLRSTWLSQYGGYWGSGFYFQGGQNYMWASNNYSTSDSIYGLYSTTTIVNPNYYYYKYAGFAVRCIAAV